MPSSVVPVQHRLRAGLVSLTAVIGAAALLGSAALVSSAQATDPQPFVTNTPPAPAISPPLFATNTPAPSPVPLTTPAAPLEQYALRLWTERELIAALIAQIDGITRPRLMNERAQAAQEDAAIALLSYELQRRFPNAPTSAADRAALLAAFDRTPIGAFDPRWFLPGVIADSLNAEALPAVIEPRTLITSGSLGLELTPLNLDSAGGQDARVEVTHLSSGEPTGFSLTIAALRAADGTWRVPPAEGEYPATPFDGAFIGRVAADDLNGDGQDEIAVRLGDSGLNLTLRILGWRGDRLVDLIAPGSPTQFGELALPENGAPLTTEIYQLGSPRWDCITAQRVTWTYTLNAFRAAPDPAGFRPQPTLACTLASLDPLYEQPVGRALASVDALLSGAGRDEAGYVRGQMALALLTALNGDTPSAVAQMNALLTGVNGEPWVRQQAEAFLTAAAAGLPPVALCAAVEAARAADGDAICAVDEVLTRLWTETPPARAVPLTEQIAALGGQVIEQTTVREVGRLDRQVITFTFGPDSGLSYRWSFAPTQPDTYTVERLEPAANPSAAPITEPTALPVPILAALVTDDDPAAALALVDSAIRDSGPTSALRYTRSLILDLLGDRTAARAGYYALWTDDPASPWGRAAALHLELR